MNAPVTRGEFVHIFHGAEEAYKAINTVADNAIPDVKATDKFAAEIYEFYRAGILTGSDAKGHVPFREHHQAQRGRGHSAQNVRSLRKSFY